MNKTKMCQLIITTLFGLVLWSCHSEKSDYERIVSEWQGRQILLPNVMADILTGNTIDMNDADFTILTYVDSIGCTGCKMKLPLWKEFLGSIDSNCESDVQFLMVVDPSGIEELNYNLKREDFDYPVYLDKENRISKTNLFPDKTLLQTFLIDRNKKVIATGNPLYSSEIARLYKDIIEGKMSVSAESGNFVSISESHISLGDLHTGEVQSREVILSNHSNDTVHIEKVVSSCDCTELSLPTTYISPRSDLQTVIHFTSDSIAGDFERTVHIYYLDFEYPTVINISGNIIH